MARFFDAPSDEAYQWGGDGQNWANIDVTMSAWIKMDTLASGGLWLGISSGATTRIYTRIATGGTTKWEHVDFFSTTTKLRRSTAVLSTATWYHLLATNSQASDLGTAIHLYRDGVEESYDTTSNGTGPHPTTNDDWMVGMNDSGTGNDDFDGDIAEVGMWSRVLTADEIKTLATGASPSFIRKGLVFYVPMRRNVWDIVGQGAPATTHGTPTVSPHPPGIYYPAFPSMYQLASAPPPADIPFLPAIAFGANV